MFDISIMVDPGRMMVYHVTYRDFGDKVVLNPMVPQFGMHGEDEEFERICVATSIPEAINSCSDLIFKDPDFRNNKHDGFKTLHVYQTEVYSSDITQPTIAGVPDVWKSGELWLTQPTRFDKLASYEICRQYHFIGTPYSRFLFTAIGSDPEIDRKIAEVVYGDFDSFSMIMLDVLYTKPVKENTQNVYGTIYRRIPYRSLKPGDRFSMEPDCSDVYMLVDHVRTFKEHTDLHGETEIKVYESYSLNDGKSLMRNCSDSCGFYINNVMVYVEMN